MSYPERKRLINDNGTYRILTQTELDDLKAAEVADLLETNNLKAKMISLVENLTYAQIDTVVENTFGNLTTAQKAFLKNLAYVVLYFSKREVRRS